MRWILFFPAFFSLTVSAQTVEDLIIKDQGKQTTAGTMIRIAVQKDPLKVVTLPLEEYIQGVLQGEIPTDWPLEALKAQAVTARTYTLYRISHPANEEYDLETTVEDQVYKKSDEIPPSVQKAVQETAGEVLKKRGEIIPAFYHSCCGGITEDPAIIWGGPSLKSVRDPNCLSCPNRSWEVEIGKERLREVL
ncbi:MAG: SpoIID/LytB domain-containing protein, partial [bacterium]|nr:SpoIID/LytB domain-containing protein [bacterium]